jgi:hypothetical protein
MEFSYEKLLKDNNISESALPEDALIGIKTIKDIVKAINMHEKKGKSVSNVVISKLKANDKWVTSEICDYINNTELNTDEDMPFEKEEVIDMIEKKPVVNNMGALIDNELISIKSKGIKSISLSDLMAYKETHKAIFDNYEEDGLNGLETSNFSLLETEREVFELKQK